MDDYSSSNPEKMERPEDDLHTEVSRLEEKMQVHKQDTHMEDTHPESVSSEAFGWLKDDECDELQSRWDAIQIEFVDDPRASVERADALIADAFERIQTEFSNRRKALSEQWNTRSDISTEDLRITLQNYRSFINRLLAL